MMTAGLTKENRTNVDELEDSEGEEAADEDSELDSGDDGK